jgi:hypothetical protein
MVRSRPSLPSLLRPQSFDAGPAPRHSGPPAFGLTSEDLLDRSHLISRVVCRLSEKSSLHHDVDSSVIRNHGYHGAAILRPAMV